MKIKNKQLAIEGITQCIKNTQEHICKVNDQSVAIIMSNQMAIMLLALDVLEEGNDETIL